MRESCGKRGFSARCSIPLCRWLSTVYNNRDHRKIAVIDGHTAFTGGINLADEYINAYVKYGHWKDSSILVRGRGRLELYHAVFADVVLRRSRRSCAPCRRSEFDRYRPGYYHPQDV